MNNQVNRSWIMEVGFSLLEWEATDKQGEEIRVIHVVID